MPTPSRKLCCSKRSLAIPQAKSSPSPPDLSASESLCEKPLAKGADRAIHIVANDLGSRDPLGLAHLLAAAITPEKPDLVLTGLQSEDLGLGQTGVILAELLGLSHASLILQVELQQTAGSQARITAKRELEEGWFQNIDLPLPALLTIQSGGNKLRYATLMGIKRAKSKECRVLSAADLAAPSTPVVTLASISLPQKKKSTQVLTGSPADIAATLVEKLKTEARVL